MRIEFSSSNGEIIATIDVTNASNIPCAGDIVDVYSDDSHRCNTLRILRRHLRYGQDGQIVIATLACEEIAG